ncbi:MAG: divalent-cation tolerance protein CutA [Deltaproteobacteria bacterium]|nr:divalent-cation tolerance protein CutA [Deltaproteobacteria bacterium]
MSLTGDADRVLVVLTTVGSEDAAVSLARALVERRLVACVNVVPAVRSIYRWQGAVQDDRELLLLAKTTAARLDDVTAALAELHPYEVPEIVALEAAAVSATYAAWLRGCVAP